MGNLCGGGAPKETKVTTADKPAPEEPLPLSVITDGKTRESKIRDVFGQLFAYWDTDRDGWLRHADWAAHNQPGAASDSAWMEMSRTSTRADGAIDRERFLEFYIRFYLPKDEAEYRMYLEHWAAVVAAHKRAWDKDAAQLQRASAGAAAGNGAGADLPRASNGYQPAAQRSAQSSPAQAPSANGIPNGATGSGASGGGRLSGGAGGGQLQPPTQPLQPLQPPSPQPLVPPTANPNTHGNAQLSSGGDGPMGSLAGTASISVTRGGGGGGGGSDTSGMGSALMTPMKGTSIPPSALATPMTPGAIPFTIPSP